VYPVSRLEEVIRAIVSSFEPLTDDERHSLAKIYQQLRVPVDQLKDSPKAFRDLTSKFNKTTHRQLSGERLVSEIFRMRKEGQLPRLQRLRPPKERLAPSRKRKKAAT
jgi:hypothetical protein